MQPQGSIRLIVAAISAVLIAIVGGNLRSSIPESTTIPTEPNSATTVRSEPETLFESGSGLALIALAPTKIMPIAHWQVPDSQAGAPIPLKEKYQILAVEKFDVLEGEEFPPEYIQLLQDEIVKEIGKSGPFKLVQIPGQKPMESDENVLQLIGTVKYFDPGSRGKRYIGFGMGAGQIVVQVAFRDRSTEKALVAEEIRATLSSGAFGGKSEGIAREFARRLATVTKLLMEKSVSRGVETAATESAAPTVPSAEHRGVTISSNEFDRAQSELNAAAAAGYRLIGFSPKGSKNAEATMERSATPPGVYDYRVLHVLWLTNLQKDMNKAASKGYRYCPHTLAQLGGAMALAIMERPLSPGDLRYEYRVRATVKVSNAQKDIAKDQSENFILVGTLETSGVHVVLMERATATSRN